MSVEERAPAARTASELRTDAHTGAHTFVVARAVPDPGPRLLLDARECVAERPAREAVHDFARFRRA